MATDLLGFYPADHRVLTDLSVIAGTSAPPLSSSQAKTGSWSYNSTGEGAFGHSNVSGLAAWRVGWWMRMASLGIDNFANLICFANSLTNHTNSLASHIRVAVASGTSELIIRRRDAAGSFETLFTSDIYPTELGTLNTWFHVGACFKCHATNGFFYVYFNGVPFVEYDGDTRLTWYDGTQHFETDAVYGLAPGGVGGGTEWTNIFIDDLYFESYTGETAAPVPSRRFFPLGPADSAGADDEFTPLASTNVSQIDEAAPNDGDTTYNKALAADLRDTFNFPAMTLPADHQIINMIPMTTTE